MPPQSFKEFRAAIETILWQQCQKAEFSEFFTRAKIWKKATAFSEVKPDKSSIIPERQVQAKTKY
ncbi:7047_t:CDS:2 [Ambispora leptoticha]|uniref:7047_t:CDS:1 n=1 Tax=Ambispora leptoticha TaxID=144679 RepID=A0A9N9F9Q1_9GLOM|nr:7047_t:CDS:2 [Ambispora leptoticha]